MYAKDELGYLSAWCIRWHILASIYLMTIVYFFFQKTVSSSRVLAICTAMKFWLQTDSKKALCKWCHFEMAKPIFKMLPVSLAESMLTSNSRPFQRVAVDLCISKGSKVTSSQRWRFDKKFCHSARIEPDECGPGSSPAPFLSSSIFEGL